MIFQHSRIQRGHVRPGYLTRAFTLIELLVVIAIIGILSAVILASLNTARSKGVDASIKSDLETVSTQAALDYDSCGANGGAYAASTVALPSAYATSWTIGSGTAGNTSVCPFGTGADGDETAETALNQAATETGGGVRAGYNASSYIVVAELTTTGAGLWCIDSTGNAKAETTVAAGATQCP